MSISLRIARPVQAIVAGLFLSLGAMQGLGAAPNSAGGLTGVGQKLFDPEHHPLATYSDAEVSLSLVPRGEGFSVVVEKKGSTGSSLVPLPNELVQVDRIARVPGNKAVIIGWANSAVSDIAIVDMKRGVLVDNFWAYQPAFSQNGRWIAFIKFLPRHFVEGPESQYRLYDLTRTPMENRPMWHATESDPIGHAMEVGTPIYSLKPGEVDRDNYNVDESEAHHSASEFFWAADSSKLVFADAQAATMSIVMVSMSPTASIQHETWIVELRGMCADDCTGVQLKSVHFSEATLETEFEQIIAGRKLPKTASRIQLPLTELRPAPR